MSFRSLRLMGVGLSLAVLVFPGCTGSGNAAKTDMGSGAAAGGTLYQRLGGAPALSAVVADFVGRAAANPHVNFTRKGTGKEWQATPENVARLKDGLVAFIGSNIGGPEKYTGQEMKPAHAGMKITSAEFDALAGDLKASLDKFKVPQKEQDELLSVVASTKRDIVEL